MSRFKTVVKFVSSIAIIMCLNATAKAARSGGGFSLGGGEMQFGILGGVTNASQDQMNTLITRANARTSEGPISTPAMNSAYELALQLGYRFSGTMFVGILRPSYFYQKANGSSSIGAGDYNYGVTGFTLFPILRMIPLENEFLKFFFQFGLGYGRAETSIQEGANNLSATGDAFGTTLGLGTEFCITASQCVSVEANYRYLFMERNIASSASGSTWGGSAGNSLSRHSQNQEVELDNDDLAIKMGGLQFLAGYVIHF